MMDTQTRQLLERSRVMPTQKSEIHPTTVPLSILDATIARFSPTQCIWLFANDDASRSNETILETLRSSLVSTLDAIPHIAGQLHYTKFNPKGNHTERWARPAITYGADSDPGVEWNVVRHASDMNSLCPEPTQLTRDGLWRASEFPESELLSNATLALHDLVECQGLPNMSIQINLFACGGYAIGVRSVHCIADSQSLLVFMHRWSAFSRRAGDQLGSPLLQSAVFDPNALDVHAAGAVDATEAETELLDKAHSLPLHRFDGWDTSAPGFPPAAAKVIEASKPSPTTMSQITQSPATQPPWLLWDAAKPVEHFHLLFTNDELGRLHNSRPSSGPNKERISRMDVLAAHLWACVNRARGLSESKETVYLDVTIGARPRVSPPLPETFLGSPLFIAYVAKPASETCNSEPAQSAIAVRQMLSQFTPEMIGAMLHDAAFEFSPQRIWQSFLGLHHLVVSSWMRLDIWDVDFESRGNRPMYVHPVMPDLDGFIQMHESKDGSGVEVGIHLEKDAMGRLLKDTHLHHEKV